MKPITCTLGWCCWAGEGGEKRHPDQGSSIRMDSHAVGWNETKWSETKTKTEWDEAKTKTKEENESIQQNEMKSLWFKLLLMFSTAHTCILGHVRQKKKNLRSKFSANFWIKILIFKIDSSHIWGFGLYIMDPGPNPKAKSKSRLGNFRQKWKIQNRNSSKFLDQKF